MEPAPFVRSEVWAFFLEHFRRRTPGWLRSSSPPTSSLLWSEAQFAAVLRFTALFNPGSFRVVREGKPIRPAAYRDRGGWVRWEAVEQLRAAGASVNLTRIESYSNPLLAFTRALEAELLCPVQINYYATPGQAQGLGAHTDPHDVLIYQLRGRKTWKVAGIDTQTDSSDGVTLSPGDWLFVPRHTWHEVRNLFPEPTAHLTIGFHPLTWGDVWQATVEDARKTMPALAETIDPAANSATAAERLSADLLPLLSALDPSRARNQYLASFRNFAVPVPPEHVVECEGGSAGEYGWRQSDAIVRSSTEFFEVDLPYRRAPLALRPDLEFAVRAMAATSRFRSAEVDLDAGTTEMLCRLLVDVGALQAAP